MWKNLIIALLAIGLLTLWLKGPQPIPHEPSNAVVVTPIEGELEPDALTSMLMEMQNASGFEAASIGFCLLKNSLTPEVAYHAHQAMTPASTLKAVTSATALEVLGPDFTYETKLACSKPFEVSETGSFDGDLILIGGGDPMLTVSTFIEWAHELRHSGLNTLAGNIIADARYFPEQMIPNAWDWGDVSNYYGAGPCGLNLDLNRFAISFQAGATIGAPTQFTLEPALPWTSQHNLVITGAESSIEWTSVYGGPYTDTLTFRGNAPLGRTVQSVGAIPDPAFFAAWQFQQALQAAGIQCRGGHSTVRRRTLAGEPDITAEEILKTNLSYPLVQIVSYLHNTSDNMVTECLFQSLIKQDSAQRPGVQIIANHWAQRGLSMKGLRMEDGSGLARADFIRPIDLAAVLWLARRGPHGEAYFNTFNRYHQNRVRWKGGAMSRVRAYTGFAQANNGTEYTFALMINNYDADAEAIAHWRGRIIEAIGNWKNPLESNAAAE